MDEEALKNKIREIIKAWITPATFSNYVDKAKLDFELDALLKGPAQSEAEKIERKLHTNLTAFFTAMILLHADMMTEVLAKLREEKII